MTWSDWVIAPEGTHHLSHGLAPYPERFDEVLKFHAPGLAPVSCAGLAWHIKPDGKAAYDVRFKRVFGFYEGLAAVESEQGAFHIDFDGQPAYGARYEWCGNFQGGRCTVRDRTGAYFHIDGTGRRSYEASWRYAGDFRDGVAVVQDERGLSTHIASDGALIHDVFFVDLDVFHKGYARARDAQGWMHIDRYGGPIYERRFAAVEPFYNGQARVEGEDGRLEIIDERGCTLVTLRGPTRSEFSALSADLVGFWRTRSIATAVELGVLDALPGRDSELALNLSLDPSRLRRLLRALSEMGLVTENGVWELTARGQYLTRDHPLTLGYAALEYAGRFSEKWARLPEAVKAEGAWAPPEVFSELANDSATCKHHHRMLESYARHDYAHVPATLGLKGTERFIDAGGGLGHLAKVLLAYQPSLELIVLDRPEVVELARATPGMPERLSFSAKNFFDEWGLRADALVLARVLHDWNDHDALLILQRARECVDCGALLFVIEMLLSENGPGGSLCDLHLLVVTGGQERTEAEYAKLFSLAGFRLQEVKRVSSLSSVLIAEAV